MKKLRKILIFGPQGSGKGTQAELLSRNFGFVYISTGNIFRQEIKDKTKLGKLALKYVNVGKLVPDEIVNAIAIKAIRKPSAQKRGFVLDGYPRSLNQAKALAAETEVTDALLIDLSDKEAIFRISGRRVCKCGRTYHIKFNPPKRKGVCDACGGKLFIRDDDQPAKIKRRLKIYHQEIKPVLQFYKEQGVLKVIDGSPPIPEVFKLVKKALGLTKGRK
jgi:adenylate kinase